MTTRTWRTRRSAVALLLASSWLLFALWFLAVGPFAHPVASVQPRSGASSARAPVQSVRPSGAHRPIYPLVETPRPPALPDGVGAEPDFDPHARPGPLPTARLSLLQLARRLPAGPSLLITLRLDALRRQPWARRILAGHSLKPVRRYLLRLGLDPLLPFRAVVGVRLEARAPQRSAAGPDVRFLGNHDRPFYLVTEGHMPRRAVLEAFRRGGPLTANLAFGRRVYQRPGEYALAFPMRGLVSWAYRMPIGPLIQGLLSKPSATPQLRRVTLALRAAGLLRSTGGHGAPRPSGTRTQARRAAPRHPPKRTRPAAPESPDARSPGASPPQRSVYSAGSNGSSVDHALPWITAVWVAQPGVEVPAPLHPLKGYTSRPALWAAVLAADPAPGHPDRVRIRLWLLYRDSATPPLIAAVLRYGRQTLSHQVRIRHAKLTDLVQSIRIQVHTTHIEAQVTLRPWHLRALSLLLHRILSTDE